MTSGYRVFGGGAEDVLYSSKSWSGGDSPKLRTPNGYTMSLFRYSRRKTTYLYVPDGSVYSSFFIAGTGKDPPAWTADDELALLSKLAEQIKGHDFNASLAFAEPVKSYQTIRNSLTAVAQMVNYARKGNFVGASRALGRITGQATPESLRKAMQVRDVAGAVLAMRYGWEPLIKDAFAAAKAIAVSTERPRALVFRCSKTVRCSLDDAASTSYTLPSSGGRTVTYRVKMLEQIGLARSMNLVDPASVVWENVPYSFVVDWFIPIGTYLEQLSFFRGLDVSYVRTEFTRMVSSGGSVNPVWWQVIIDPGSFDGVRVTLSRTVGVGLNVPRPSFKDLSAAFSLRHSQNLAALIFTAAASANDNTRRTRELEVRQLTNLIETKPTKWKRGTSKTL